MITPLLKKNTFPSINRVSIMPLYHRLVAVIDDRIPTTDTSPLVNQTVVRMDFDGPTTV